jgi:hypothetical protein
VRLLRRRAKTFEIQVQDFTLRVTARDDVEEEARAAALSFWEQLQSYGLRHADFNSSKRPLRVVAADAPDIVKEVVAAASAAGVQACLPKPDGFGMALHYLQRVPGVRGGVVVIGDRIGVAGAVEIAG